MSRSYLAVLHEYLEETAPLSDEEFGRLIRAMLKYSATGEETALEGNERFYFKRMVNQEVRHQQHYEELSRLRSEAGRRGAQARWGMANDGKHGNTNTETHTKTKTKHKTNSLPSKDGRRAAVPAGREINDCLKKDMVWLEGFVQQTKGSEDA